LEASAEDAAEDAALSPQAHKESSIAAAMIIARIFVFMGFSS
jgi:hypothetical protein